LLVAVAVALGVLVAFAAAALPGFAVARSSPRARAGFVEEEVEEGRGERAVEDATFARVARYPGGVNGDAPHVGASRPSSRLERA
jgi:hypothetical protein